MRRLFIAGNWKMHLDLAAARALVADVRARILGRPPADIAVCPPSVYLMPMAKAAADSPIALGAQNCWDRPEGAFTGEVSPRMLKDAGCAYVILGHSERRHTIGPPAPGGGVHGETDEMVASKCRAALAEGLTPIVCVGEKLAERDAGQTEAVLARQIQGSLSGLTPAMLEAAGSEAAPRLVIAYEPVWAIGTGRNATPAQAQQAHAYIRRLLAERFGTGVGERIRIQYGGSVKPGNAHELLSGPDVDGALVGGASLVAADFVGIIDQAIRAKGNRLKGI